MSYAESAAIPQVQVLVDAMDLMQLPIWLVLPLGYTIQMLPSWSRDNGPEPQMPSGKSSCCGSESYSGIELGTSVASGPVQAAEHVSSAVLTRFHAYVSQYKVAGEDPQTLVCTTPTTLKSANTLGTSAARRKISLRVAIIISTWLNVVSRLSRKF